MKTFINVVKKVAVITLILALFASVGCNVYQYFKYNQMVDCCEEIFDLVDDSCWEAAENMSVSDRIMFQNTVERNCSDEKLEEIVSKYYLIYD